MAGRRHTVRQSKVASCHAASRGLSHFGIRKCLLPPGTAFCPSQVPPARVWFSVHGMRLSALHRETYRTTHPSKATQDLRSHLDASPRGPHIIPLLRLHAQCPCHSCRLCGRAHGILPLRQTCFSPFFRSNSSDTSNTSVLYALNQRLSFSGIHGIFRRPAPFTVCTHALSPPATEKVLAGVLRPCWGL